jgi:hypothetical protein
LIIAAVEQKCTKQFIFTDIEDVCPYSETLKKWFVWLFGTGLGGPKMEEGAKEGYWSGNVYSTEIMG